MANRYKRYLIEEDLPVPRTTKYNRREGVLSQGYEISVSERTEEDVHVDNMPVPQESECGDDFGQEDSNMDDESLETGDTEEETSAVEEVDDVALANCINEGRGEVVQVGNASVLEESESEDGFVQDESLQDGDSADMDDSDSGEDDGDQQIDDRLTSDQFTLILQAFVLKHHLTKAALQDLLSLVRLLDPTIAPSSTYLFRKLFTDTLTIYKKHFYCKVCHSYIGEQNSDLPEQCPDCEEAFTLETSLKEGMFFIVFPMKNQLQDLYENYRVHEELKEAAISHGTEYRKLVEHNIIGTDDITMLWNCDGIPAFRSSSFSIWPLQCTINELPASLQQKHFILPGIWFGTEKPRMDCFLRPFVNECINLSDVGFTWEVNGTVNVTKVHMLICSSDSVARPLIRNTKQFNGQYGCDWCEHPGERVPKRNGFVRAYTVLDDSPEDRTHYEFIQCAEQAVMEDEPVLGVKGPSVTLLLPNFNIIKGFVPDYLHCVLLGVVRQIVGLWTDSENHAKPWYLPPRKQRQLDNRLTKLTPPSEVCRRPRSLSLKKFWKGSEWRTFILYYSLIVLKGLLPSVYLRHWFLLVFGIYTLLGDTVDAREIDRASLALQQFVIQMQELYGNHEMTFNVHQLLHLGDCVRNWGPLWSISTFFFEGNNGHLKNLFNGTRYTALQICESFSISRDIQRRSKEAFPNVTRSKLLFSKLFYGLTEHSRPVRYSGEFVSLDVPEQQQISVRERIAVEQLLGQRVQNTSMMVHHRVVISGKLYTSENYTICSKRRNHCFMGSDRRIYTVKSFAVLKPFCLCDVHECDCVAMPLIFIRPHERLGASLFSDNITHVSSHFLYEYRQTEFTRACRPSFLMKKCFYICLAGSIFVIPLANSVEHE